MIPYVPSDSVNKVIVWVGEAVLLGVGVDVSVGGTVAGGTTVDVNSTVA